MIIVMSGVDGAGKSTQISLLSEHYKKLGCKVQVLWGRGGYTPLFKFLKRALRISKTAKAAPSNSVNLSRGGILKSKLGSWLWLHIAIFDLILFYAIYARFLSARGLVVICDRYIEDTFLDFTLNFQDRFNPKWVLWRLLNKVSPEPSSSFLLLVSVDVSMYRAELKNDPFPDTREVLEWRYTKYNDNSIFSDDRYNVIDSSDSIEGVHKNIISVLQRK